MSAALLFCLFISSLTVVPGYADDDSWLASEGIGLSGGNVDGWSAPSEAERDEPSVTGGDTTSDRDPDLVEVTGTGEKKPANEGDSEDGSDSTDGREGGFVDVDYGSDYASVGDSDDSGSDSDDYSSDVSDYSLNNLEIGFSDISADLDDIYTDFDGINLEGDIEDIWLDSYGDSYGDRMTPNDVDDMDYEYYRGRGKGTGMAKYSGIDYESDDSDGQEDTDYDYGESRRGNRRRSRYDDIDYDESDVGVGRRGRGRKRYRGPDYETDSDPDYDLGDSDSDPDYDPGDSDTVPDYDFDDYGDPDSGYSLRRVGRRNRDKSSSRGRSSKLRGASRQVERSVVQTRSSARSDDSIEIDDGTVTPDEIPKDYFGQEPQQTGKNGRGNRGGVDDGGLGVVSGSIDFPGFRLIISEPTEWWKYDLNVCLSKEFLRPTEVDADADESDTDFIMYTVRCADASTTEYSCNVTQRNDTATTTYRLAYTCCPGFTRLRTERGCPRKSSESYQIVPSFEALLRKHDYSQKIIDLFNTVLTSDTKKRWTVFLPSKAALDKALMQVNFKESRQETVPDWFVQTMLNHFVQPAISTSSMRHGQVLTTSFKSGSGLFITKTKRGEILINCQRIVKADQSFNNYSFAHFLPSVLDINAKNIFQLMLKRLERVVTPVMAGKLLAPLKAQLTGAARQVTVFMHLPSKEELHNGCYARNLRSVIVQGAECNSSLWNSNTLLTLDGKPLRLTRAKGRIVINGDRQVAGEEQVASNGVLYIVHPNNSLIGYTNEVIRKLKDSKRFKPLFNRTNGSLALLIPPHKGSYTYANTSARWDNATELIEFGTRHLLDNATALVGRGGSFKMLDGTLRNFALVVAMQESISIFGPDRSVRYRFVDCVRIMQIAKDCSGTIYYFLRGGLPDFRTSPPALEYLNRTRTDRSDKFTVVKKIVQFALEQNKTELSNRLKQNDTSIVLLKDTDMYQLTGQLFNRRRQPTKEQMEKLTLWFSAYFVASKNICAAKSVATSLMIPVFQIERLRCRTIICAFRRRFKLQLKRVQLRPDSRIIVREGFLLPGQIASDE